LDVVRTQDTDDTLFFIDPPYLHATRSGGAFYRHEMIEADHRAMLERLRSVKGLVVLAGYASELYDHALHDWRRITRPHRAAGSRKPRTEMLWINPGAAQSLRLACPDVAPTVIPLLSLQLQINPVIAQNHPHLSRDASLWRASLFQS
jgi:hypothetical protein